MNWYSIFYWISVADNIKLVTGVLTIGLGIYMIFAVAAAFGAFDGGNFRQWEKGSRRVFYIFSFFFFLNFILWAFIPSKKDALIIVAGGTVGNFIQSDTTVKQIPSEVMLLLRERIKSEIKDLKSETIKDTLANKTREELIELLQKK